MMPSLSSSSGECPVQDPDGTRSQGVGGHVFLMRKIPSGAVQGWLSAGKCDGTENPQSQCHGILTPIGEILLYSQPYLGTCECRVPVLELRSHVSRVLGLHREFRNSVGILPGLVMASGSEDIWDICYSRPVVQVARPHHQAVDTSIRLSGVLIVVTKMRSVVGV